MTHAEYLNQALVLAREAAAIGEVPVGAVVVRDGVVIATGANRRETDKVPVSHAEIYALNEAARKIGDWRLTGCTLYVTLEPCPMCLAACQQARVDRVVYGAKDPKGGALSLGFNLNGDVRLNHRFEAEYEPSPDCEAILKTFFSETRAKKK